MFNHLVSEIPFIFGQRAVLRRLIPIHFTLNCEQLLLQCFDLSKADAMVDYLKRLRRRCVIGARLRETCETNT